MDPRIAKSIAAIVSTTAELIAAKSSPDYDKVADLLGTIARHTDVIYGAIAAIELDAEANDSGTASSGSTPTKAAARKFQAKALFKRFVAPLAPALGGDEAVFASGVDFTKHYLRIVATCYPESEREPIAAMFNTYRGREAGFKTADERDEAHDALLDNLFKTVFNNARLKKAHGDLHDLFFRDPAEAAFLDSISAVKGYSFVAALA